MAQSPRQTARSSLLDKLTHGPRIMEPEGLAHLIPIYGPIWKAAADFQRAPPIPRPNAIESLAPVVGPGWESAADFQAANYGGAALNAGFAMADAVPAGTAVKGGRAAVKLAGATGKAGDLSRTVRVLRGDLKTANTVQRRMHKVGLAEKGDEVHHVFELNGTPRNVPTWKNSYFFLKALPRETHRRLHGDFLGQKEFGVAGKLWHGTTDWMKTGTVGLLGKVADVAEQILPSPYPENWSE